MIEINKLKKLIDENLSQREIAKNFDCSQSTVKYYLKKYNLNTNIKATKDTYVSKAESKKAKQKRNIVSVHNRRLSQKIKAIDYKGGKCQICNYKKSNRALSFHHINPDEKDIKLTSTNIAGRKWEVIKNELDKCILLCANCHMEVHEGITSCN